MADTVAAAHVPRLRRAAGPRRGLVEVLVRIGGLQRLVGIGHAVARQRIGRPVGERGRLRPGDAHDLLDLGVVGGKIGVGHRPVPPHAVARLHLEVARQHPGRAGPPAIRASAETDVELPDLVCPRALRCGDPVGRGHVDGTVAAVGDLVGMLDERAPFQDEETGVGRGPLQPLAQEETARKTAADEHDIVVSHSRPNSSHTTRGRRLTPVPADPRPC